MTVFLKAAVLSESSFLLQFSHHCVVDQIFGFETPDFFIAHAEKADDVANPVNTWINFSLVQIDHALIPIFGIFDALKAERTGKAFGHLRFVLRIANKRRALEKGAQQTFQGRRRSSYEAALGD